MSQHHRVLVPALIVVLSYVGNGQTQLYIPDPNPLVPGGTAVNTIPFGSASYTYMGLIPASLLDPVNTRIHDIAFAPGANGTWNAANVLVGIGHVPNPLPCPFTFPGPGATTLGSFLDFTVMYDSSAQGPINWVWNQAQWSPLGLPSHGSPFFTWNGLDDIGVYITFQSASPTSGFHRAPTGPPTRTYASGYQAVQSSSCNATFGVVISLYASPSNNLLSIVQSGPGVGDLQVTLASLSPTASEGWILPTGAVSSPPGTGPLLGIVPDGLTWSVFTFPLFDGNPFHFFVPSPGGLFPSSPFVLPPGSSLPVGLTLDFVALLVRPGPNYDGRSNVVRFTFQ